MENVEGACPQKRGLDPEVIRDVYDGKEYLRHHHFLSKGENVSLNTDGVALLRSSKVAIWPIWTAINELPPNQRSVGMGGMEQIAQPVLEVLYTCCE